jgi:hypothetical protein
VEYREGLMSLIQTPALDLHKGSPRAAHFAAGD